MKRLFLLFSLAAPLGCSSVPGPWMTEFDKDPDLQINIWEKPGDAAKPKPAESAPKE